MKSKCLKCNEINYPDANFCRVCGTDFKKRTQFIRTNEEIQNESENSMMNRYPTLKTISFIYLTSAWLVVIGTTIGIFYSLYLFGDENIGEGLILIGIYLIYGFIGFITLLASSEGIKLFVNIANDIREMKISNRNN